MIELFVFLKAHLAEIVQAIVYIIAGASVLANLTKTDKDNKAIGVISKFVNALAVNIKSGKLK